MDAEAGPIIHIAKMTSVAGMEKHLLTLLPGLRGRGVDARVIVLTEPDKQMGSYIADMQRLGVPAEAMLIHSDFEPGLIGRLAGKLRDSKAAAVHTHLIHADLHGTLAARRAGIRRVYWTSHNDDRFRHRIPVRLLQGWLWRSVTAGITISDALREFVIRYEFAPANRVHTVHYGLDADGTQAQPDTRDKLRQELGLSPNAPILGSVCRLTEQKGISFAIRAFWEIAEQAQGANYVIVGDGPLRASLEHEAKAFGIGNRVHFLGWRENAADLMAAFDVLLVPSLWEGFGMVALEAMAAGIPVIASRVSALPEIVANGETGFLAAPGEPSALAECLLHIVQYPELAREMGQNGRRRLEDSFSTQRMVDGTLEVYRA